jgi:hypothetical protein
VHGGTWYLEQPLVLGPGDSGTPNAPVTYAAAPGETAILSGGLRLDCRWTAYGGCVPEWHSFNGAYSLTSRRRYTLSDGRIRFAGTGLASDGDIDNDPKDTIEYSFRGDLSWSKQQNRWIGFIWTGLPGWEMEDTARVSLREGIDVSAIVAYVLKMKSYIFWGISLFLLFAWLRHRRGPNGLTFLRPILPASRS